MPHPISRTAWLVASGDMRDAANRLCWPTQVDVEARITTAFADRGVTLRRAHGDDARRSHGFISGQRMGMDVFAGIPVEAPVVVAISAWQYSHHVLAGLRSHRGPILTVANWSGQWPGLVGLLNLNGSLVKAGVRFSTIWSVDFTDALFLRAIDEWIAGGRITHDTSHVRPLSAHALPPNATDLGRTLAQAMTTRKAILGVFDEGCMGMYNAIIDDELLNPIGMYKERLSQSALVAEMRGVTSEEAGRIRQWLDRKGVRFMTGPDPATDLTDAQVIEQSRMYIAALRMADRFACDAIGIQYQVGLIDVTPASDLVEGLLNNVDRPPAFDAAGRELYAGRALPHFNEVDEGAGVDAVVTNRCWTALGWDPATTLHDVRWGEHYSGDGVDAFVWLLQISGAAPASHFVNGYAGASSMRQPAMYFPSGGGSLRGVGRPGPIVWSRVFVEEGQLHADIGRGTVVALPDRETERRWTATTREWPIVHTVLHGVGRDGFMARHRANHVSIVYAPTPEDADHGLAVKAAMLDALGVRVHLCGVRLGTA